jgi:hypothetical protein
MPTRADVKKIALSLEGTSEIDHWHRPAWRTAKRIFAVMRPDGLWLHLPEERREFLFAADPKAFVKYMWGKRAEIIVQIERVSNKELRALISEAHVNAQPEPKKSWRQRKPRAG